MGGRSAPLLENIMTDWTEGQTLEELLKIAENNGHQMSDRALIKLNLALTTEIWRGLDKLEARVSGLSEEIEDLKEHPSLLHLFHTNPKQVVGGLLVFMLVMSAIVEFEWCHKIGELMGWL